jgi:hypothetical protein
MSNEHDDEGNHANQRARRERDSEDEAMLARRTSPKQILLLLMLLLVILLIAVAAGRGVLIRFPGAGGSTSPSPTLSPIIGGQNGSQAQGANHPDLAGQSTDGNSTQSNAGNPSPACSPPGAAQQISSRFLNYYNQYGGMQTFGRPISTEINNGGHFMQWFERARLEEWPELSSTRYLIQGGRVGVEFTQGIAFPKQTFFVNRPGIRYFAETGHGVRDPFLSFWLQDGGLDVFGYPISDEVNEELDDGQLHLVQYFERARLEYHPASDQQIQIGLLGHALCLGNSRPKIVVPAQPTAVPLP